MASLAASFVLSRTVVARVACVALLTAILSKALLGSVNVDAEPGSAVAPRAEDVSVLPVEYRSVRCAGFDYDPPPIPPSELWPAQ